MRSVYAIETLLGVMHAIEEDGKVVRLLLPGITAPPTEGRPQTGLKNELNEYLAGRRKTFSVPFTADGPAFHKAAWDAALAIPYGSTVTYHKLAADAGHPLAARAAGQAMAKNPLPILLPCHRVVYAHGKKQSYLGGAEMKEFLLGLERSHL